MRRGGGTPVCKAYRHGLGPAAPVAFKGFGGNKYVLFGLVASKCCCCLHTRDVNHFFTLL